MNKFNKSILLTVFMMFSNSYSSWLDSMSNQAARVINNLSDNYQISKDSAVAGFTIGALTGFAGGISDSSLLSIHTLSFFTLNALYTNVMKDAAANSSRTLANAGIASLQKELPDAYTKIIFLGSKQLVFSALGLTVGITAGKIARNAGIKLFSLAKYIKSKLNKKNSEDKEKKTEPQGPVSTKKTANTNSIPATH